MTMRTAVSRCLPTLFSIAAFIALLVSSSAVGSAQSEKQLSVADLVKRSSAAVVQVVISDQAGKELALGSGFIVSSDGKIVTNYHVIQGAHSAIVKLANGSFFPVEGVLAVDAEKDLALLKVEGTELPFLNLGSARSVQVGDHVIAIGSPLGLEGTVSDGIVSALREEGPDQSWIQTTTPVSHGNSGGPLLNMSGEVIGVITWGVNLQEGQNLNFAIPSDEVKALMSTAARLSPLDSIGAKQQSSLMQPAVGASAQIQDGAAEQPSDQDVSGEQHAIEQVHAITESIKRCPGSEFPDQYGTRFVSAPLNAVSEVVPGESSSSGKTAIIEWVQHVTYIPKVLKECKKRDKRCQNDYWMAQQMATTMMGVPYPDDFRLEFDLGSHGLALRRKLWKHETEDNIHWVAATYIYACESDALSMTMGERPALINPLLWEGAKSGDAEAMLRLGAIYQIGKDVPPNRSEALHWYQRAADMGNAKAEYLLGAMYLDGQGGGSPNLDYPQGLFWLRKSAEQGDAGGEARLGMAYYAGEGVAEDPTEAYFWFSLAAMAPSSSENVELAQKNKDEISARLKGAKLKDVEQRISEWLETHPKAQ